MEKGKLIIFEAVDGAGKTTQLELAIQELKAQGYNVVSTREPGGTDIGEKIRELLLSDTIRDKTTEAFLFASARTEHNLKIRNWIKQGKIVLCDRHYLSSLVYQGEKLSPYVVKQINSFPNLILSSNNIEANYVLLDINKESFIKRLNGRDEKNHFDLELTETFENKRRRYLQYGNQLKARVIDANGSVEDTHKKIMKEIKKIIEN